MSKSATNQSSSSNQHEKSYMKMEKYLENEPDLYLILRHKIYPTHSEFIKKCCSISRKLVSGKNVLLLDIKAENEIFQNVLKLLYGGTLIIPRDSGIQKLIQVNEQLEFVDLEIEIYQDILSYFREYDIFIIYKISTDHKIQWLTDKCDEELTRQDYKQLSLSKDQLMQLGKQTFLQILRNHNNLKARRIIMGLPSQLILNIIQQYSVANYQQFDIAQFIKGQTTVENQPEQDQINMNREQLNFKKKDSFSSDTSSEPNSPKLKQNILTLQQRVSNYKLELMRKDKQIKDSIIQIDCVASPLIDLEQVNLKMLSFESWSFNQENKFMSIQNQGEFGIVSEKDSCEEDADSENQERRNPNSVKKSQQILHVPQVNRNVCF